MAAVGENGARTVHFGTFEVDLHAGELRRNGSKVKLQEQPFQVLTLLLERPGSVVTREELQKRLWAADTFVDFDHSLNAAIRRLRDELGDSAENPRFVETVARRGYRFVAPVNGESATLPAQTPARIFAEPRHRKILWAALILAIGVAAARSSRTGRAVRFSSNSGGSPPIPMIIRCSGRRFRPMANIWRSPTIQASICARSTAAKFTP